MSFGPFPQHFDVLSASPASEADRARVVEELKQRGNQAFKRASMAEAEALYDRAIELEPGTAALWGNRCAARLAMKKFEAALADADEAVKVDASWAKGHFRRGQALAGLARWGEARGAFERTLALEPANKDAARELDKIKAVGSPTPTPTPSSQAAAPASAPAPPKPAASTSSTSSTTTVIEDEEFTASDHVRGYKKRADGRTTTFFDREIDPEEKRRLAEENRPKPIAPGATTAGAGPQPVASTAPGNGSGTSVWNAAGTFEERDMTQWATDKLKSLVVGATSICDVTPSESVLVEATGVSAVEGTASVSFIRGKKKRPFDFTFNVDWRCELADGADVAGKLFVSDFNSELSDIAVDLRWDSRDAAKDHADVLSRHLRTEFKAVVESRLAEWRKAWADA